MAQNYPKIVVPPPGPKAQAVIARDRRYASTSYVKIYDLVVERGEGTMVEDVDGNRYLDFMSGIATSSTGHSHPKVVAAIEQAARKFLHICATDFYYPVMTDLIERLAKFAPGSHPKRVFLSNSGAEAIEGAIKLARKHTKRANVLAFEGAFHGRTLGMISLNSSNVNYRRHFGPLLPGVYHLPYAYPYRCAIGQQPAECTKSCTCSQESSDVLFSQRVAPDEIAAVVVEPILGEGGYVVPPPGFLRFWRDFCDEHGAMLIFDEVQTGIGRTGRMFAAEVFDVVPDVICLAKGLASGMPISAMIVKESMMAFPRGSHGSTFGGNPVCCAAALATLDLVESELMANAARIGPLLLDGVRALQKKHDVIGDVRGIGLMIGIEFVEDRATKSPAEDLVARLQEAAFRKGLLLLSCGRSTIRIAPPLIIDEEDAATGLRILGEVLTELRVAA